MSDAKPNIVLIMSDQHHPRVMGCAGDDVVRTPNLDRLARGGVRFTDASCPYPLCGPSRMAFMTGRYAHEVNIWDNTSVLASDTPTFAHALSDAGYEPALCGRMHFNGEDQLHGFAQRLVGDAGPYLAPHIMGRGLNRTNGQTRYAVEVSGHGRTGFEVFDREVTDTAVQFITQRRDEAQPYCLVVGYILPHNPLICERGLFEHYMDALPPLDEQMAAPPDSPAMHAWRQRRGVDQLSDEHIRRARAAYYGLVTTMDRHVGAVLDAAGDDTVVIYCSDHGEQNGEHGLWWKSTFYQGSIGVPLIASRPGHFAAGAEVDAVVNLIDLAPTLVDIAGGEAMADVSGRSLLPMLRDGRAPDDWPNATFAECIGAHGDQPSAMLREGAWKLMWYPEFDAALLYNLDDDPREVNDRGNDPACAALRDDMLTKLQSRWSPRMMLDGVAAERATRQPSPEIESKSLPADANVFDFAQVPGWDEIRKRVYRSGSGNSGGCSVATE